MRTVFGVVFALLGAASVADGQVWLGRGPHSTAYTLLGSGGACAGTAGALLGSWQVTVLGHAAALWWYWRAAKARRAERARGA